MPTARLAMDLEALLYLQGTLWARAYPARKVETGKQEASGHHARSFGAGESRKRGQDVTPTPERWHVCELQAARPGAWHTAAMQLPQAKASRCCLPRAHPTKAAVPKRAQVAPGALHSVARTLVDQHQTCRLAYNC